MKIFKALGIGVMALLWAWIIISYIQIFLFNGSADPYSHYSAWNIFIILFVK